MSNKDRLLMAILECGDADLSVLDDTQYDLGEIVGNLQYETDNTEEGKMEHESLQEEIDVLESLDPDKDMNWYCNWLDTSCWLSGNEAIYWEYLEEEIISIEDNMGFTF